MNFNTSQKKSVKGKGKTSIIDKKHQANLKKNNGLYFQIGLIVSLFLVFGAFQLKFEKVNQFTEDIILNEDEVLYVSAPVFEIEKKVESKQKIQKEVKQQKLIDKFIETSDDDKIIETIIKTTDDPLITDKVVKVKDIEVVDLVDEVQPISLNLVQHLPVFPGCEKFKGDKKKQMDCFSKKISKHINKKFDSDIAAENGITGRQKVFVAFTINDSGEVVDVKARGPHPAVQKEAIKAVISLPKMQPAKQGYKKVGVTYALPIVFDVQ